jgi:hypothetical protein
LHQYLYVGANLVAHVDPTGHEVLGSVTFASGQASTIAFCGVAQASCAGFKSVSIGARLDAVDGDAANSNLSRQALSEHFHGAFVPA